ncbi:MAG TPA: SusE domain-containing protein, partial [Aquaticitalea sp.]|nr:SusE domain-containing protein [Aquaticitalea sp.]
MKTIMNKAIFLLSILFAITSCDDVEHLVINENVDTVVSLSTSSIVLTEETSTDEVLTVTWSEPDFGFTAAPTYRVLIDFAGGDFSNPQDVSAGILRSKTFTGRELNSKLIALGLEPLAETAIDIRVESKLSNTQVFLS